MARVLGEAAVTAGRTDTFLGERYRRIPGVAATRKPSSRSAAPSWSSSGTCSGPDARFHDLGSGFYDTRIGPDRKKRNHVRQLEALGYTVTLEPA